LVGYSGTKTTAATDPWKGFILNLDITENLMSGDSILMIYLQIYQVGSGSKLAYCKIPPNTGADPTATPPVVGTPSLADDCKFWKDNYEGNTNDSANFSINEGYNLVKLQIRKNASNNSFDLKIGTNAWVILNFYKNRRKTKLLKMEKFMLEYQEQMNFILEMP
jgi:hypothetical protein